MPNLEFLFGRIEEILSTSSVVVAALILYFFAAKIKTAVIEQILDDRVYGRQKRRILRYVNYFKSAFRAIVLVVACGAILFFWLPELWQKIVPYLLPLRFVLVQAVLLCIFIVIWEIIYYFLYRAIYVRLESNPQRASTLFPFAVNIASSILFAVYFMIFLREIGIDILPLLTGAGIVGIVVGLGAQQTVKDIISGFTIILEDLVQVGDVVKIAGNSGLIEKVTLRKIQLRDLKGAVLTVPHSEIKVIENMTKIYSYYLSDILVSYDADLDKVFDLINRTVEEMRADPQFQALILEPVEILGVDQFGDNAIFVKCRIKTPPIKQWDVGRAFNKRLKEVFDRNGIVIPFPQRTVRLVTEKPISVDSNSVR